MNEQDQYIKYLENQLRNATNILVRADVALSDMQATIDAQQLTIVAMQRNKTQLWGLN